MALPIDILANRPLSELKAPEETLRYSRHLIMAEVGSEGQKRFKSAKVLVIGTGGLGSPLALYLAAAGIGELGLVDFDQVDLSNLQRQILHTTNDVGKSKLLSAKEKLTALNPNLRVNLYDTKLDSSNAMDIMRPYDVIVDGTDNFPTRYLVNDACVLLNKPNVYGSIFQFDGQASVFFPPYGPCYRCLYPQPPAPGEVPSCAEGGVLGILPAVIGSIQATETIKLLLNRGDLLIGRLLHYDAMQMKFREFKLRRNPKCVLCSNERSIHQLIDYEEFCGVRGQSASGGSTSSIPETAPSSGKTQLTAEELKERMATSSKVFILDVRNPNEIAICRLPGSVVIPLPELPQRFHELPKDQEIIVHCKSGMRSAKAIQFLREQGFTQLINLSGGIMAWAERIDSTMARY